MVKWDVFFLALLITVTMVIAVPNFQVKTNIEVNNNQGKK